MDCTVLISSDLDHSTEVTPVAVSSPEAIPGNTGYETIELELPADSLAGLTQLFVIIDIRPKEGT